MDDNKDKKSGPKSEACCHCLKRISKSINRNAPLHAFCCQKDIVSKIMEPSLTRVRVDKEAVDQEYSITYKSIILMERR